MDNVWGLVLAFLAGVVATFIADRRRQGQEHDAWLRDKRYEAMFDLLNTVHENRNVGGPRQCEEAKAQVETAYMRASFVVPRNLHRYLTPFTLAVVKVLELEDIETETRRERLTTLLWRMAAIAQTRLGFNRKAAQDARDTPKLWLPWESNSASWDRIAVGLDAPDRDPNFNPETKVSPPPHN